MRPAAGKVADERRRVETCGVMACLAFILEVYTRTPSKENMPHTRPFRLHGPHDPPQPPREATTSVIAAHSAHAAGENLVAAFQDDEIFGRFQYRRQQQ